MTTKYKLVPTGSTLDMRIAGLKVAQSYKEIEHLDWIALSEIYDAMLEAAPAQESEPVAFSDKTALQQYNECVSPKDNLSAIERLRAFCSFAMKSNDEDWLDVEPFFDDVIKELEAQESEPKEDLYWRLHSLSKSIEGSGRLDEFNNPDACDTLIDAMNYVQKHEAQESEPVAYAEVKFRSSQPWPPNIDLNFTHKGFGTIGKSVNPDNNYNELGLAIFKIPLFTQPPADKDAERIAELTAQNKS